MNKTLFLLLLPVFYGFSLAPMDERIFRQQLVQNAFQRTKVAIVYSAQYFKLTYPKGDIPEGFGVCTDVIIRVYRKLGIDLQEEVHNDMRNHFSIYPKIWGLNRPDHNIDHRRVPNLHTFFQRHAKPLSLSENPDHYQPGDIVIWLLPGNLTHIGIVADKYKGSVPLVIHNIGSGPRMEDRLFAYKITGHFYYQPQAMLKHE